MSGEVLRARLTAVLREREKWNAAMEGFEAAMNKLMDRYVTESDEERSDLARQLLQDGELRIHDALASARHEYEAGFDVTRCSTDKRHWWAKEED